MDLGCSGGFFLDIVKKKGWETFGIEINKKEFNIAKKKNHKVWNVELSKIDKKEKFDVITLWDVFEHIKDPHTILQEMKKRLNRVLINDPGLGVARHYDAGYSKAKKIAKERGIKIPISK